MFTAIKWFYHPTVRPMYFSMDRAARRDSLAYSAHLAASMVFDFPGCSPQEWNNLSEDKKEAAIKSSFWILRHSEEIKHSIQAHEKTTDNFVNIIQNNFEIDLTNKAWFTPTEDILFVLNQSGWEARNKRAESMLLSKELKGLGLKKSYLWMKDENSSRNGYYGIKLIQK